MARISTLILCCLIAGKAVFAEIETSAIRGRVVDAVSFEPIADANVIVLGTDFGAATDLDGNFNITGIEPGTYHLQASALGYKIETRSEISVLPGRTVDLEFRLQPSMIEREEVEVKSGFFQPVPNMPLSSRSFTYEEIRRAPGAAEDVQRSLQALPGVYSRNDQTNEIIVRGGSPNENLTRLDGLEIDNINHFPEQSSSGGPISAINSEFLEEAAFSSGGFSARYGDKLSSVLDIELREGDPELFSGQVELSMAGAGLNVEGGIPGTEETSFLFSARKSYLDLIKGPIGLTAIPHYWDSQFKIGTNLNPRTNISLIGLYANDHASVDAEEEDAWSRGAESVIVKGYTFALGGRARAASKFGFTEIVVGRSEAYYSYDVYEVEKYYPQDDTTRSGALTNKRLFYRTRSTETNDQIHLTWKNKVRSVDELSVGITVKPVSFSYDTWLEPDTTAYDFNDDSFPDKVIVHPELIVNKKTTSLKYGSFLQYRWRPVNNFAFTGGIRLDGFQYSKEQTIAPRLSLKWNFQTNWTASLSYGHYYQSQSLVTYTIDERNRDLPHSRSDHCVAGINWLITPSTQLSLEGYYKFYRDLPVSENWLNREKDLVARSFQSFAIGRKEAWGAEFFVQQKLAGNWYGTLSYSYGKSEIKAAGERFPANFDFRHVGTLVLGYKISGLPARKFQRKWYGLWANALPISGDEVIFSTKYRYVSGRPYTPQIWTREGPRLDYRWEDSSEENSARYPHYSRWDIRLDSKYYFGKNAMVIFLEIENLLDRKNAANYIHADNGEIDTVYQFRFFFVGGVRFEW